MMKDFELSPIEYGSLEYYAEVSLRNAILRSPLGLSFSTEELAQEFDSFHLGYFKNERLLACLVLKPLSADEIKMRQVAVAPESQGHGIGRILVEYSEQFAKERGFKLMVLHARDTAIPFYEKLNYLKRGGEFLEVTIPHWEMFKEL